MTELPILEGPDAGLIKGLEDFAAEVQKGHLGSPADLRWELAFNGPQRAGELGPDFELDDARTATLKVAGELVGRLPRRVRRALAREDADLLTNLLQFACARGLVSGVRWAKGIGAAEPPR